jgi:hypothetical protein
MTETEIRSELARIVSRFGAEVRPSEVPEEIVASYAHGLATGQWYLKTPRATDHHIVLYAIAGINAAIESRSTQELSEAGHILLGAVLRAIGSTGQALGDRIVIEASGKTTQIVLHKRRYGRPSKPILLGEVSA